MDSSGTRRATSVEPLLEAKHTNAVVSLKPSESLAKTLLDQSTDRLTLAVSKPALEAEPRKRASRKSTKKKTPQKKAVSEDKGAKVPRKKTTKTKRATKKKSARKKGEPEQ
jgi:hypothetical protein